MRTILYSAIFCGFLINTAFSSDKPQFKSRTWTSNRGAVIEAALVKQDRYFAILQKSDGSTVKISPSALSKVDQEYLSKAATVSRYGEMKPFLKVASRSGGGRELRFMCHPNGFLVLGTFVDHKNAGVDTALILPDQSKFVPALEKGIEWCRVAKETNAQSDSKYLYNMLEEKIGCLDGMSVSFRAQNWIPSASSSASHVESLRARSRNKSNIAFPLVEIDIYKEAFPYSQSANIVLYEEDLKIIVAELKKVPFDLIKELASVKDEEVKEIYK